MAEAAGPDALRVDHVFVPHFPRMLRFLEPPFVGASVGGQYLVLSRKRA